MSKRGNEPAFPITDPTNDFHRPGLTKRELFAAMAMQGTLSDPTPEHVALDVSEVAEIAVAQADALLAALEGDSDETR